MSDLIERLRDRITPHYINSTGRPAQQSGWKADALCLEAAVEIEQLRAALAASVEANTAQVSCRTAVARLRSQLEASEADARRMREALLSLLAVQGVDEYGSGYIQYLADKGDGFYAAVAKARAALSEPTEEKNRA